MLVAAVPSLPVAVLMLEPSLRIRSANEAAVTFLRQLQPEWPDLPSSPTLAEWLPDAALELRAWQESSRPELALDTCAGGQSLRVLLQREPAGDSGEVTAVLCPLGISGGRIGTLVNGDASASVSPYAEALLCSQGVLVIVFNASGRLLRCNPTFERLTGYSEETLRNSGWFELLVPRDRYPEVWAEVQQYRADAPPAEYSHPLLTADGEERWITWRHNVVHDADVVRETVSIGLDVTESTRDQEKLRRSEQQNRTLLASLSQRIFFKDEAGRFVLVNEPFAADFGLLPAEFIGKTDADLFPPELAAKYRADDRMVMETRRSYQLVEQNLTAGLSRFVEVAKSPVVGDDGEIQGVLGMFTDVTDRKRMEEALAHERDLLHILMDSIPDLIYFKDRRSRFTRVNRAQAAHLGLDDPRAAEGKSDWDIYPDQECQGFLADEQEIFRTGRPMIGKAERVSAPGQPTRWYSTTKAPILDSEGQVVGLVGVGRDVTDRMHAEAELQKTAAELIRSNEELEQFAYVASHDLQEPLRMVASYTQLLARRYADKLDEDAREFIDYAVDGAMRMQGLIQDLLEYSRVGTRGKPFEWVDCNRALGRVQDHLQLAISEQGALVEAEPLPTVFGDPSQLMQLFQNLLGNAVKFRGNAAPRVRISAECAQDEWLFRVRDNGIGIDPEYAERIFVIFQRLHAKSEYPGSGIGLSICKKIVQRHGGRIWLESAVGEGATFCFTLPVSARQPFAEQGWGPTTP